MVRIVGMFMLDVRKGLDVFRSEKPLNAWKEHLRQNRTNETIWMRYPHACLKIDACVCSSVRRINGQTRVNIS